jgi:ATP-dependent protease ClpP protease subunit
MSSNKKFSPHTLFSTSTDTSQHFRLFLDDIFHDGAQIHELLNSLHNAGDEDTLEVRINSGGGFVKYGQQLINVINGKFSERCITVIEADACSMAALIFMAGDRRVVYEHSILMVHDLSMYLVGKASESKKQLEAETYVFKNKFISLFENCLSEEEIDNIFEGKDQWFDAQEMCSRGLATHVITREFGMLTASEYLEKLENPESSKIEILEDELEQCTAVLVELKNKISEFEEKQNSIKEELSRLKNENSSGGQATE